LKNLSSPPTSGYQAKEAGKYPVKAMTMRVIKPKLNQKAAKDLSLHHHRRSKGMVKKAANSKMIP
jgi:hypothetical protein